MYVVSNLSIFQQLFPMDYVPFEITYFSSTATDPENLHHTESVNNVNQNDVSKTTSYEASGKTGVSPELVTESGDGKAMSDIKTAESETVARDVSKTTESRETQSPETSRTTAASSADVRATSDSETAESGETVARGVSKTTERSETRSPETLRTEKVSTAGGSTDWRAMYDSVTAEIGETVARDVGNTAESSEMGSPEPSRTDDVSTAGVSTEHNYQNFQTSSALTSDSSTPSQFTAGGASNVSLTSDLQMPSDPKKFVNPGLHVIFNISQAGVSDFQKQIVPNLQKNVSEASNSNSKQNSTPDPQQKMTFDLQRKVKALLCFPNATLTCATIRYPSSETHLLSNGSLKVSRNLYIFYFIYLLRILV
jgi:hypothetical protein